jgi:hypothetical protein
MIGHERGGTVWPNRVHQTLRVTPARAAGITDHVWELGEPIALMPKPVAKAWGSVKRVPANA